MTTHTSSPKRLYLMQVAFIPQVNIPIVAYLVQMSDGTNVLIDSGLPADMSAMPIPPGAPPPSIGKNVQEQLAEIGLKPSDINYLVCTHYDLDHAGNHALFTDAELIVQRKEYEVARAGHPRFASSRSQWDHPALRYRQIDGDLELLPGLELIDTKGHTPGHQSVLVRLPNTGPVLLAIDAVRKQSSFVHDHKADRMDDNEEALIASTRKLLDLVQREHVRLVIFGHDGDQWATLKKLPEFYA